MRRNRKKIAECNSKTEFSQVLFNTSKIFLWKCNILIWIFSRSLSLTTTNQLLWMSCKYNWIKLTTMILKQFGSLGFRYLKTFLKLCTDNSLYFISSKFFFRLAKYKYIFEKDKWNGFLENARTFAASFTIHTFYLDVTFPWLLNKGILRVFYP